MPFTTSTDGVRIYYEAQGTGPAVVFVHGSGGHHAAWWQQVPRLRDRFTVVTLDLRGFGRSASALDEFDSRAFPDDIAAVLAAAEVGPAVLVGQSIGAAAALKTALRTPVSAAGVVLAHSLGGIDHPDLAARVRADRAVAEKLPVLDRLLTPRFQTDEPAKTFLFQQMGSFNTAKMADLRNLNSDGPTIEDVVGSGIPLCFLAGENDAVLRPDTVRAAAALIPSATLELVATAPHSMYWEAPELFNTALIRFLEKAHAHDLSAAGELI
ncbi:alpha/beta fold hydrolase [Parafrankia discariae]|uniref:alpha/beta fold hydrolase n=1 Tax=Parafrankia discariae TaxID=365528 RepID=UPI000361CDAA|nr:alpha/beta hydrolase [Parafrankia discariae]